MSLIYFLKFLTSKNSLHQCRTASLREVYIHDKLHTQTCPLVLGTPRSRELQQKQEYQPKTHGCCHFNNHLSNSEQVHLNRPRKAHGGSRHGRNTTHRPKLLPILRPRGVRSRRCPPASHLPLIFPNRRPSLLLHLRIGRHTSPHLRIDGRHETLNHRVSCKGCSSQILLG